MLADEPTGELDSVTAREIYTLFHQLVARYPLTIIIVSHDPHVAAYVDRVVTIRDGKISTETVKVVSPTGERAAPDFPAAEGDAPDAAVDFSEYVVVDSVGRLQIPADLREEYAIAGRVRLTRHPDGVLIQPEP